MAARPTPATILADARTPAEPMPRSAVNLTRFLVASLLVAAGVTGCTDERDRAELEAQLKELNAQATELARQLKTAAKEKAASLEDELASVMDRREEILAGLKELGVEIGEKAGDAVENVKDLLERK